MTPPDSPQQQQQPYYGNPATGVPGTPGAAWPPTPGYAAPGVAENTSGTNGPVPPEVANLKWSWGAFVLPWFWLMAHKQVAAGVILLLAAAGLNVVSRLLPLVGFLGYGFLAVYIYLALNGHKLAWRWRRYEGGVAQYMAVETAWMRWGAGIFIAAVVIGVIAGFLIAAGLVMGGHMHGRSV